MPSFKWAGLESLVGDSGLMLDIPRLEKQKDEKQWSSLKFPFQAFCQQSL